MVMARSKDDRGDAIRWYLHLRVTQERARGIALAEIGRRTGITKVQLSQLMNSGKTGGGIISLIRFAEYVGRTPGQMLDEALAWWGKGDGKAYARATMRALVDVQEPASERRPSKPASA